MAFQKSGQGPRSKMQHLCCFFLLFVALLFVSGFAPKSASQVPNSSVQQEVAACPPVVMPSPAIPEASSETSAYPSVNSEIEELSSLWKEDSEYDAGLPDGEAASVEALEDIAEVPSISEIVLAQYADWRGVRYRAGGSDARGVDCSGLVQAVFKDAFQIDLPRSSVLQSRLGDSVPRNAIQPGDLVYFVDRGRKHVGVAVNEHQFLHSSRRKGVILSEFDGYWSSRLLRVRRVLNEAN